VGISEPGPEAGGHAGPARRRGRGAGVGDGTGTGPERGRASDTCPPALQGRGASSTRTRTRVLRTGHPSRVLEPCVTWTTIYPGGIMHFRVKPAIRCGGRLCAHQRFPTPAHRRLHCRGVRKPPARRDSPLAEVVCPRYHLGRADRERAAVAPPQHWSEAGDHGRRVMSIPAVREIVRVAGMPGVHHLGGMQQSPRSR